MDKTVDGKYMKISYQWIGSFFLHYGFSTCQVAIVQSNECYQSIALLLLLLYFHRSFNPSWNKVHDADDADDDDHNSSKFNNSSSSSNNNNNSNSNSNNNHNNNQPTTTASNSHGAPASANQSLPNPSDASFEGPKVETTIGREVWWVERPKFELFLGPQKKAGVPNCSKFKQNHQFSGFISFWATDKWLFACSLHLCDFKRTRNTSLNSCTRIK